MNIAIILGITFLSLVLFLGAFTYMFIKIALLGKGPDNEKTTRVFPRANKVSKNSTDL